MEKLKSLIEVKKIMALCMTALFIVLAIRKDVSSEQAMSVIVMIMTYYFTQSVNKENK